MAKDVGEDMITLAIQWEVREALATERLRCMRLLWSMFTESVADSAVDSAVAVAYHVSCLTLYPDWDGTPPKREHVMTFDVSGRAAPHRPKPAAGEKDDA